NLLSERGFNTDLTGRPDEVSKTVEPPFACGGWVFPVSEDVFLLDVVALFHVLVVELWHEQARGLPGADQEEERSFERLEASAGQIVDAVERRDNKEIESRLSDTGLQVRLTQLVFLARDSQHL